MFELSFCTVIPDVFAEENDLGFDIARPRSNYRIEGTTPIGEVEGNVLMARAREFKVIWELPIGAGGEDNFVGGWKS